MKITRNLEPIKSIVATVMPWAVFACLAAAMLFDPGRDTLGVASAAFAVALALAAVTFSYARTLNEGSAVRDELVFAGEWLVTGAVLFLVASILKHSSNDIPRYANTLFDLVPRPEGGRPDVTLFGQNLFGLMLAVPAFFFFLLGLIYAQMGMTILFGTASHRVKRRPGHDDYFSSGKIVQERVAGLDQADKEGMEGKNGVAVSQVQNPP